jgi:hypothetical protein
LRGESRDGLDYCARVTPKIDVALSFTQADMSTGKPQDNEPLVIIGIIDGFEVHQVFVDQGSLVNIMFWSLFEKLRLHTKDLIPHPKILIGFTGDTIIPKGYVEFTCAFGDKPGCRIFPVKFLL